MAVPVIGKIGTKLFVSSVMSVHSLPSGSSMAVPVVSMICTMAVSVFSNVCTMAVSVFSNVCTTAVFSSVRSVPWLFSLQ